MEPNKLTTRANEALATAQTLAAGRGNATVEPAHLLSTLLGQADGTAGPLLRAVGADPARVRAENVAALAQLPSASGATVSAPQFGGAVLRVLAAGRKQA